ncbi:MAG: 50S ribosomal protein L18e [Thermoprotei archaeon]|nr:MAG: 50S ribosomal protein L18e [Thermoprotei archaeon]
MRRTGPTNIVIRKLIRELRKSSRRNRARIWSYIADLLEKPSRSRVIVNVSKINRFATQGETVVIPGKVLGAGLIDKPVTVAALSFSAKALEKIANAGGRVLFISELVRENPRGKGVKVLM